MSALLHPVGPEPERTYWLRRAVVLAVVLLVVAVVASVAGNLTGGRQPISAAPAPQTPSVDEPTMTPTADATPSTLVTPSATPLPSTTASTRASAKARSTAKAAPTPALTAAVVPLCQPAQLRATITGTSKLKPAEDTTFRLSLINGAPVSCLVEVTAANFELKIYSGTDRIWSSRDCDTAVKPVTKRVASQQAVEWKMTWNGLRSKAGCKNRAEKPKPGTYFATSQLTGAKPAQLRMILRS